VPAWKSGWKKDHLALRGMEAGLGKTVGAGFLKTRIYKRGSRAKGMVYGKALLKSEDFKPVFSLTFRIVLVLFFFLFEFFAEVAFPFTFQFRPIPVLAKDGGDIPLIQLIINDNKAFAEGLAQHACQQYYRSNVFHRAAKIVLWL
jgi:hypothetical protein